MFKAGAALFVCLVTTALFPCSAQDVTPPPAGPTIRVTTTEVALDMVVRDKKGRQAKNLKPGDVEIYEDGVKQPITSFRLVTAREQEPAKPGQPAKLQPSSTSLPLRELNTICIVFHNIDPVVRPHAVAAVKEFIRSNLPPESYIGIFNLNEKLIPVHEFTKNREELLSSNLAGTGLDFNSASVALLSASPNVTTVNAQVNTATHTASVTVDTTGGEVSRTAILNADVATGAGANRLRGDQVREQSDFGNLFGMHETDRMSALVSQLTPLPGRKSVLLVSTGLKLTGDPDLLQKIITNANAHGITVYSLDITELADNTSSVQAGKEALDRQASVSRQQTNRGANAQQMHDNARAGDDILAAVRTSNTQSALRALSEGTGGFLIANTNDFRKPFQQLAENLEAHYEAVYKPTSIKYDGRLHKIEVKVARNDLDVESRTGYFAMPDLKGSGPMTPEEFTAMSVLNVEHRPHAFDFHVAAYHFQKDAATPVAALAFDLPGAKLGDAVDPSTKTHKFEVSLLALIRDANGEVVDKYSLTKPYYIPEANLAAVRAEDLTYTHPLDLPPGHYTVDTAIVDRSGAQATTATSSFEIPAPPKGIGISSLVMVQSLDPAGAAPDLADPFTFKDKHIVPMVDAKVAGASKRYIYFVVYKNKANAEKPKMRLEFKNAGQVFADQTVDLPEPDAAGAIAMFVGAASRPGNCELRITAMQGDESAGEQLTYQAAQ